MTLNDKGRVHLIRLGKKLFDPLSGIKWVFWRSRNPSKKSVDSDLKTPPLHFWTTKWGELNEPLPEAFELKLRLGFTEWPWLSTMSKSHSGDAWMKIIGIGEHNVKKSKGKNPENTKGWGTSLFLQFLTLTFPSFEEYFGLDVFIYNYISLGKYKVASGLMCAFRANKILLTVFTANWFPWQWKPTCKNYCKNVISVIRMVSFIQKFNEHFYKIIEGWGLNENMVFTFFLYP